MMGLRVGKVSGPYNDRETSKLSECQDLAHLQPSGLLKVSLSKIVFYRGVSQAKVLLLEPKGRIQRASLSASCYSMIIRDWQLVVIFFDTVIKTSVHGEMYVSSKALPRDLTQANPSHPSCSLK